MDRLQSLIDQFGNPSVVGLDPLPEYIPEHIMQKHVKARGETLAAAADAYVEFNSGLIDALCDIVPAIKPQSAYYELLGYEGVRALKETCDYAKAKGLYVIVDGKRNDIGSTATAYSEAYLGSVTIGGSVIAPFDADAVTVNAYLGSDGLLPFLETAKRCDKAFFALVKTSNPSGKELQDLEINGKTVYLTVAELIERGAAETVGESGYTRAGAVVGATYPEELRELRSRLKHTFFLVPGYGAQGGTAADVVGAFDRNGRGAIVNSSRGVICAWKKSGGRAEDYAGAARAEAIKMRDAIRSAMQTV
jgi:orotidine-5'-phosphate decarboxylase